MYGVRIADKRTKFGCGCTLDFYRKVVGLFVQIRCSLLSQGRIDNDVTLYILPLILWLSMHRVRYIRAD